ncbi:SDR family NAD(P)-dependent oxidoreductase [bacterium]|nr:SDR family NAD(P)-dependent oxidoreductase [bacterium]QQR59925.1 MAG: SDR family NAD(P)-dependent oxidoreductase [Candidatus Melainabacteria bacterium]
MKGKKVLVTGAAGFIGSHLTEQLVHNGCLVTALVHYNSRNDWGWLEYCSNDVRNSLNVKLGDVTDSEYVHTLVNDQDVVFNLAALIAIPYSYHAPESYINTNVKGSLNVVQAAKRSNKTKVVQISTSEVYGTAKFVPITENHQLCGQSPYAASKIGADQIALSFFHAFQTPVTVVRPFNTFGPRQSARAVIPTIISQLSAGSDKIKLGATAPTRDFTYVDDTVNGIITAGFSDKTNGEVFNLGTGFEVSIGQTVDLIKELMNSDAVIEIDQSRLRPESSEVERLCSDNSKVLQYCGWQPTHSGIDGLRIGLKKTIEWFSKKENLEKYKTGLYNV